MKNHVACPIKFCSIWTPIYLYNSQRHDQCLSRGEIYFIKPLIKHMLINKLKSFTVIIYKIQMYLINKNRNFLFSLLDVIMDN